MPEQEKNLYNLHIATNIYNILSIIKREYKYSTI